MSLKPHQYSCNIFGKNIGIIGPFPPRLGGISIHIKRVVHKLEQQQNSVRVIDVVQFSTRVKRWRALITFFYQTKPAFVFYHTLYNSSIEWLITILGSFFYRAELIVVEHSPRHLYDRRALDLFIFRHTMRAARKQIFIGSSTHQSYIDNKIPIMKNFSIESAYLPPDPQEEPAILATYPAALWKFLETHGPIIAMNASRITLWHGKDLYGLDVSLALLKRLKETFPSLGLICALAHRDNPAYFAQLESYIAENNLTSSVYFLENNTEFWPLLKRVNLFIRPTLSDGWAVSLIEAQELGTPTLASNAVLRPAGTLLYDVHDHDDLYEKTKSILRALFAHPERSRRVKRQNMQSLVVPEHQTKIDCNRT